MSQRPMNELDMKTISARMEARARLSRRVAKIMHSPTILGLTLETKMRFVESFAGMHKFEDLPKWVQDVILTAETS